VDPAAVRFLSSFSAWRSAADIPFPDPDSSLGEVRRQIRQLERCGLLLREGTPAARQDTRLRTVWRHWLPQASFHFATKDTPFLSLGRAEKHNRALAAKSPPPPKFKSYPKAPQVRLPKEMAASDAEFPRVLLARRTHRRFSPQSLPLDCVSKLLYYTWGVTASVNSAAFGPLPAKTSPSGGSRHPVEVYLLALRVSGLAQGLYHYDCRRHRLALLRSGNFSRQAGQYCAGQKWVGEAAAVFLMTAVFPRSMWKYRIPRAYRVVLLDAGHLGQTFCLVATWLGLAPFSTAALSDTQIEADLGLDGIGESVLFVTAAGVPVSGGASFALPRK
jgi:SagB-type dehydrogenase family enzyme